MRCIVVSLLMSRSWEGRRGEGDSIFPIDRRINTFFSFLSLPSVSVLFFYRVSWNTNNRISRCSFNSFYLTTCYLVSSLQLRFPAACARLHLYNRPLDDRSTFFSYRRSHAKRSYFAELCPFDWQREIRSSREISSSSATVYPTLITSSAVPSANFASVFRYREGEKEIPLSLSRSTKF